MFTILSTLGLAHSFKNLLILLFSYLFLLIVYIRYITKSGHVTNTILLVLIPMLTDVEKNKLINIHNVVNNK
jgi:hypothetical protein